MSAIAKNEFSSKGNIRTVHSLIFVYILYMLKYVRNQ